MDIPGNDQEVCPLSSSSGGEETRQINPGEFGSPTYQPPGPIQIERESPEEEEKWSSQIRNHLVATSILHHSRSDYVYMTWSCLE